jgi:hypothetical protein
MASDGEEPQRAWFPWLVSGAWSLLIPIANHLRLWRGLQPVSQDFGPKVEQGLEAVLVKTTAVNIAVAAAASLLTCWLVYRQRRRNQNRLIASVVGDVGLVIVLFAAPWVAVSVNHGPPYPGMLSVWLGSGVVARSIPSLCAILAWLTFALATRARRSSHVEQAA